jgi:hypothetical protein
LININTRGYACCHASIQSFREEAIMSVNVGRVDQVVRIMVGVGLLSLLFLSKNDVRLLGLIGIAPLATGLVGYCPLYSMLGLNTCGRKTKAA